MISQFLKMLGKTEHVETFLEEEVDGLLLLEANRDVYKDLGVTTCVEYAQIAVLFKRKLLGVETIYCSVSELIESNKKLANHEDTLKKVGVDVDMLQYAQNNNSLEELLTEIGISKALEQRRFAIALKNISLSAATPDKKST